MGLAGYIENGVLTEEGMYRAADTIGAFIGVLSKFQIQNVSVFATASLRNAINQEEAVRFIEERTGHRVEVISGDEEARLDFIGATQFLSVQDGVLVDIGGGSTEVVLFAGGRISNLTSIPMGSLNMYTCLLYTSPGSSSLSKSSPRPSAEKSAGWRLEKKTNTPSNNKITLRLINRGG